MNTSTFSNELAERLARATIRQNHFAESIGISAATFNRYVKGKRLPDREHIEKIARALGWPVIDAMKTAGFHYEDGFETEKITQIGSAVWGQIVNLPDPDRAEAVALIVEMARTFASLRTRKAAHSMLVYRTSHFCRLEN